MTTITDYISLHRSKFKGPKAAIVERWNARVLPRNLQLQGRTGATLYLESYGKGISAAKVVELALMADSAGAGEMAAGFWEKAFNLETGRTESATPGAAPAAPVDTSRRRHAPLLNEFPAHLQPGRIATMQPTDATVDRPTYIGHPAYYGMPKRDGHRCVVFATAREIVHQARSMTIHPTFSPVFDEALRLAAQEVGPFILDGEKYFLDAFEGEHRTAAQAAQANLNLGRGEVAPLPAYSAFKALFWKTDLTGAPETQRLDAGARIVSVILKKHRLPGVHLESTPVAKTTEEKRLLTIRQKAEEREGEIWVRFDCSYAPGKSHHSAIIRTKYVIEVEAIVTGFTETTAAGRPFGAINVADQDGRSLGAIGTGFDSATAEELVRRHASAPGKVKILVRAQGRTENGMLWHPRFLDFSS
jgi:bifunctional non-homologous end joining protein LigD